MSVVFNNAELYVADYPALDGIEVIDKRAGRAVFLRADAARRFRDDLARFVASGPDSEAFDDFIDHYSTLMTQPAIYH